MLEGDDLGAYAQHCEWLEDTAGSVLGVLPTREQALAEPEDDPRRAEIAARVESVLQKVRCQSDEIGLRLARFVMN